MFTQRSEVAVTMSSFHSIPSRLIDHTSIRTFHDDSLPVGAVGYFESSALTLNGVDDTMQAAIRTGLSTHVGGATRRSRKLFRLPWR